MRSNARISSGEMKAADRNHSTLRIEARQLRHGFMRSK